MSNRNSKWYMVHMSLELCLGTWLLMQRELGNGFQLRSGPIISVILCGLQNADIYIFCGGWRSF